MVIVNVSVSCQNCLNDFDSVAKVNMTNKGLLMSTVIRDMKSQGWHVGANAVLCPKCLEKKTKSKEICKYCKNSSINTGQRWCRFKGTPAYEIKVSENDTCEKFEGEKI